MVLIQTFHCIRLCDTFPFLVLKKCIIGYNVDIIFDLERLVQFHGQGACCTRQIPYHWLRCRQNKHNPAHLRQFPLQPVSLLQDKPCCQDHPLNGCMPPLTFGVFFVHYGVRSYIVFHVNDIFGDCENGLVIGWVTKSVIHIMHIRGMRGTSFCRT